MEKGEPGVIVLVVHYTIRPGAEGQAAEHIRKMQEHTRREPGCRFYFGHHSIDNPRRFLFYEQYDNRAALEAHRAAPYFEQNITNGMAKLAENISRELFEPVE
jgi:quinol monooxygenase YgiN